MKKVLSLLVAFVFMQTQTWALSGGPVFPGTGGTGTLVGSYGGVLIPQPSADADDDGQPSTRATSIGVFTLAVPDEGLSEGELILFINGAAYTGTVTGVVDPDSAKFSGVVEGASVFDIISQVQTGTDDNGNPIFTEQRTKLLTQGSLEATILQRSGRTSSGTSTSAARLKGVATLETFRFIGPQGPVVIDTVNYQVDGFRQTPGITGA